MVKCVSGYMVSHIHTQSLSTLDRDGRAVQMLHSNKQFRMLLDCNPGPPCSVLRISVGAGVKGLHIASTDSSQSRRAWLQIIAFQIELRWKGIWLDYISESGMMAGS